METHKEKTRKAYTEYAEDFETRTRDYLINRLYAEVSLFLLAMGDERGILDLGSGPGRDSIYFKGKGFEPVAVDITPEMVRRCQDKGLEAYVMDAENLDFEDGSFGGVWAYTSLLHLEKEKFPKALDEVSRVLKPKGIFFIGMREGEGEGIRKSVNYPGEEIYISFYQDGELKCLLGKNFEVLDFSRTEMDEDHIYLNHLCRKR